MFPRCIFEKDTEQGPSCDSRPHFFISGLLLHHRVLVRIPGHIIMAYAFEVHHVVVTVVVALQIQQGKTGHHRWSSIPSRYLSISRQDRFDSRMVHAIIWRLLRLTSLCSFRVQSRGCRDAPSSLAHGCQELTEFTYLIRVLQIHRSSWRVWGMERPRTTMVTTMTTIVTTRDSRRRTTNADR